MGPADVVILALVAVALVASVRRIVGRSRSGSCDGCSLGDACPSHGDPAGSCAAAEDMLRRAEGDLERSARAEGRGRDE